MTTKVRPSSVAPESVMSTMCSWRIDDASRASCTSRCATSGRSRYFSRSTLTATGLRQQHVRAPRTPRPCRLRRSCASGDSDRRACGPTSASTGRRLWALVVHRCFRRKEDHAAGQDQHHDRDPRPAARAARRLQRLVAPSPSRSRGARACSASGREHRSAPPASPVTRRSCATRIARAVSPALAGACGLRRAPSSAPPASPPSSLGFGSARARRRRGARRAALLRGSTYLALHSCEQK